MNRALFCGTAVVAIAIGQGALAQDRAATGLAEIVVTAQRRAEKLEDVPMAITAITPQAAENRGIRNMQDLGQAVAGVQVNMSGAYTYPAVRGVSSLTTGVGFENNVALYIDGFYQPDAIAVNVDFANLESLQVLKGPQGALYGRNATGGAILLTTLRPSEVFTGKLEFRYGNFDDRAASAYISGPISEAVRFSLAAYGRESDGYYDKLDASGRKIGNAAPLKSAAVRGKLEADLTDNLKATLGYNFIEHEDGRGSMYTNEEFRAPTLPPKVGRLYEPRTFATNRGKVPLIAAIINEGTLTLNWDAPFGSVSSYTGYAYRRMRVVFDFDASWADLSFNNQRYIEDTFQQGVDIRIDKVKNLDLIIGGTYLADRTKNRNGEAYTTNTLRTRTVLNNIANAWALFADGSYEVTDRLTLGFGARYTVEDREARTLSIVFPQQTYAAPPLTGAKRTFKNFSPRASLRYELEPGTNIYGQVSRGFRSGFVQGINTVGQVLVREVRPETITAYEVGFKTARSSYRFDAAAFYYDYKNFQTGVSVPNPLTPATPLNIIDNAPKAEIYGVEAQLTFEPVERLEINLSAAWLHARYKAFTNATGNGLNIATMQNVANQVQDWTGVQMARAPDFTAALSVSYEFPDVFNGDLLATANFKYTDSYVTNAPSVYGPLAGPALAKQQRYREGAYSLVNAALNWSDSEERYTVGVWVSNIFDVDYHISRNGSAFGDYGAWASPRTYGVKVGYKY